MVSIPIPDDYFRGYDYRLLKEPFSGKFYYQIVEELRPRSAVNLQYCHLDPDIDPELHRGRDWVPIFGQVGTAQSILRNNGVSVGDIFLFFGWFRGTVEEEGRMRYARKRDGLDFFRYGDIHAVFGHLEVKEIVSDQEEMQERFPWHPHSDRTGNPNNKNNTMYVGDRKSSGVLSFDGKRVLTKEGCSRSIWDQEKLSWIHKEQDSLSKIPHFADGMVQFGGRWQELVVRNAGEECIDWAEEILKG